MEEKLQAVKKKYKSSIKKYKEQNKKIIQDGEQIQQKFSESIKLIRKYEEQKDSSPKSPIQESKKKKKVYASDSGKKSGKDCKKNNEYQEESTKRNNIEDYKNQLQQVFNSKNKDSEQLIKEKDDIIFDLQQQLQTSLNYISEIERNNRELQLRVQLKEKEIDQLKQKEVVSFQDNFFNSNKSNKVSNRLIQEPQVQNFQDDNEQSMNSQTSESMEINNQKNNLLYQKRHMLLMELSKQQPVKTVQDWLNSLNDSQIDIYYEQISQQIASVHHGSINQNPVLEIQNTHSNSTMSQQQDKFDYLEGQINQLYSKIDQQNKIINQQQDESYDTEQMVNNSSSNTTNLNKQSLHTFTQSDLHKESVISQHQKSQIQQDNALEVCQLMNSISNNSNLLQRSNKKNLQGFYDNNLIDLVNSLDHQSCQNRKKDIFQNNSLNQISEESDMTLQQIQDKITNLY